MFAGHRVDDFAIDACGVDEAVPQPSRHGVVRGLYGGSQVVSLSVASKHLDDLCQSECVRAQGGRGDAVVHLGVHLCVCSGADRPHLRDGDGPAVAVEALLRVVLCQWTQPRVASSTSSTDSRTDLVERMLAFIEHRNQTATPFKWVDNATRAA